jgi:hypothetical protein
MQGLEADDYVNVDRSTISRIIRQFTPFVFHIPSKRIGDGLAIVGSLSLGKIGCGILIAGELLLHRRE